MPLPGPFTRTIIWPILRFTRRLSRLIPSYPLERAKLSLLLQYAKFTRSRLILAKDVTKENSKRNKPSIHTRSVLQNFDPKLLPTDDPSQGAETVFGKIVIRDPVNSIKFAYAAYNLLPADNLIFWTDACVTKNGGAGVAVVVYEREPHVWMRETIAGNIPSSTVAEAAAVVKALDIAIRFAESGLQTDRVHVFSDDLSGLNILKGFQNTASGSWMFPMLAARVRRLQSLGVNVSLHWVRGHSGVKGNSLADLAATEFLEEASHKASRIAITGRADLEHALSLPLPALRIVSEACRQDPKIKIQHNIKALESRLRGVPLDLGSKFRKSKKWISANSQTLLDQIINGRERRKARWMAIEQAAQRRNKKRESKTHKSPEPRGSVKKILGVAQSKTTVLSERQIKASTLADIKYPNTRPLELSLPLLKKPHRRYAPSRRLELDLSTVGHDRADRSELQHENKA